MTADLAAAYVHDADVNNDRDVPKMLAEIAEAQTLPDLAGASVSAYGYVAHAAQGGQRTGIERLLARIKDAHDQRRAVLAEPYLRVLAEHLTT